MISIEKLVFVNTKINYIIKDNTMFKIGDEVRLVRGWSRMIIIGFTDDGQVIAKYDRGDNSYCGVTKEDFKNPLNACSKYIRDREGFVPWDGVSPTKPTTPNYIITKGEYKGKKGTFMGVTSRGKNVLVLENDEVITINSKSIEEIKLNTFSVKAVNTNYRCSYIVPQGYTICKGDLLVSDSGNLYFVTQINTKNTNPRGVFSGARFIRESFK